MKNKTIDFHHLNEIIASYKYYDAANRFKRVTSVTQDEIAKKGYEISFIDGHKFSKEEVLRQTLQFVYMMLTDFYVEVNLFKNDVGLEIEFDTKIHTNKMRQKDLFSKEDIGTYLDRRRYISIGNIEIPEYNNSHPTACMKFKHKQSDSLEVLSPKLVDFLGTYPIVYYLNDNEHGKNIDLCPKIDEMANKYFTRHIIPRFKDSKVTSKLLNHCQKVLYVDDILLEINVTFAGMNIEIVRFHKQLAEDIYYSIVYVLIEQIQKLDDIDINGKLNNKILNDKAGHRRIEKYFFSTSHRKINQYLNEIDDRREQMKRLHTDIASTLKFFS